MTIKANWTSTKIAQVLVNAGLFSSLAAARSVVENYASQLGWQKMIAVTSKLLSDINYGKGKEIQS